MLITGEHMMLYRQTFENTLKTPNLCPKNGVHLNVDCDIFFFSPFSYLFDALDIHRVLLTPHWRTPHPNCNPKEYRLLFSNGLYNAGFFGANSNAVDVMDWWAENCLYSYEKASFQREYYDHTILNLMPLYF
jgi:hypothetical protein